MKTFQLYIAVFLLSFSTAFAQEKETPPEGGEPKNYNLPAKEIVTLDNGLKLVMIKYGSIPKATVQFTVKTGNINENEDQVWLADLLADLMQEGSTTKSATDIADQMAAMGGDLSISVGNHTSSLTSSVLYEFAPDAVELMADVLRNPLWPEESLDRLKNDMKRDLAVRVSRPRSQAFRDFMATMYPDHAYGRVYPTEEMVDSFTTEDIKDFYESNFGARRTTVYVVGNFNRDMVVDAVQNSMAEWREGEDSNYPVAEAVTAGGTKIIDRPGAPQSSIYFGLPVADPSSPDYIDLDVTNSVLGGSFASRITSNIREDKGYSYSPYSTLSEYYKSGLWYEVADVSTEHTGASLEEIKKEIALLQSEAPSQEELDGVINYESGIFVLQNSSRGGIINQLVFLDIHDLPDSFLENKVQNFYGVTPAKVSEMTRKYIRPEEMTLIIVGDKEKIESQIQETLDKPLKQ